MQGTHRGARSWQTRRGLWLQLGLALLLALTLAVSLRETGRADSDVLDQHNPHPDTVHSSGPLLGPSTATGDTGDYPKIGQSFTAGITGTLDRVKLVLGQTGTFPGAASVNVQIYATDSLNYPTGSPLASASIPVSTISPSFPGGWVEADFSPGATVINGTVYAIVLTCEGDCGSGWIEWNTSECDYGPPNNAEACDYPRGNQYYLKDEQWSAAYENADDDHIFQTFVIPSTQAIQTTVTLSSSNPTSIPYQIGSINLSATATVTANSNTVTTGQIAFNVTSTDGNTFYCQTDPITVDRSGTASGTCDFTSYPAVGTYTITAIYTDPSNTYTASSASSTLGVTAVAPDLKFDLSGLPAKTYGDPSFSVVSYASSNSPGTISFALGQSSAGCSVTSAGMVTITGAGTCVIEANQAATTNYAAASPVSSSFTIAQATPNLHWNPAASYLYYGDVLPNSYFNPGANATGIGFPTPEVVDGRFSYTYSGTTNGGETISGPATSSTILPAGSYTLTATFTSNNPNYTSGASASVSQTINKTRPTVNWALGINLQSYQWQSFTIYNLPYGTPLLPGILNATATGFDGQPLAGTFTYTDAVTHAVISPDDILPVKGSSPPGSVYPIVETFTPEDTDNYTVQGGTRFLFEVDPVSLTVTANDQSMTYHGVVPDFTVSYAGFVNNEGPSVLNGGVSCVVKTASGTTIDPSSALPGAYTIDCAGSTLSDTNYTISYVTGTLTINPVGTTTTVTTNPTVSYGTTGVSLDATVSSAEANVSVNEGTVTFTVTKGTTMLCTSSAVTVVIGAVSNVPCTFTSPPSTGSYTITATYADDAANAIFAGSSGSGTLTITNDVTVVGGEPIVVKHNYWALVQLQVLDAEGKNISSRKLKVTTENLAPAGQSWSGKNGNFVHAFQFGRISKGNGYQLSINSRTLRTGDYTLSYGIAGDPVIHTVTIRVVP